MIGILLMLLTAIVACVLGQVSVETHRNRRVRVPVRNLRQAKHEMAADDAP
jgi:hypothetical protein